MSRVFARYRALPRGSSFARRLSGTWPAEARPRMSGPCMKQKRPRRLLPLTRSRVERPRGNRTANVSPLRGCSVTVVRDLIDTWDLSAEQAAAAGLPTTRQHDADRINAFWFDQRFPAVWGARVADSWRDLLTAET